MINTYPYLPEPYLDQQTKTIKARFRPMMRIRISQDRGQISQAFDALVDSGSDRNLFPMYFANKLRIRLDKRVKKVRGIGDSIITAQIAKINIWIGTKKYATEADFSVDQNLPLLGRDGFFNLFKSIKFDENKKLLYIEE